MKKEIIIKNQSFDVFTKDDAPEIQTKIDLIMLSYNGLKSTREFLNHYLRNTSDEWKNKIRIIWIDNGSEDGTISYLKNKFNKLPKAILVSLTSNLGVIKGRNMGLFVREKLKNNSDYIMFLDNDQYVQENWVEQHVKVLEEGKFDLIGIEAWQMNKRFLPVKKLDNDIKNFRTYFHYVGCGGMLFKSDIVNSIGYLNEEFGKAYYEDPDFVFRALKNGYKIGWNLNAKIIHFPHQTLGKLKKNEKQMKFIESMKKFQKIWKGHQVINIVMKNSDIFKS